MKISVTIPEASIHKVDISSPKRELIRDVF
jgi:hypothetical protein